MKSLTSVWTRVALCIWAATHAAPLAAAPLDDPQCIVPAKPGGGFDVTCRLAQAMFANGSALKSPLRINYLPGGIGVAAYHATVRERPADPNIIVAFSEGSLLNLAQGRFGPYTGSEVRWVAAIGVDYGVVVVRQDSPFKNLKDLVSALRSNLQGVVFGAGGTLGSQDWMKAALIAQAASADHKGIRFVGFEGGGEALEALLGGHVNVVTGDAAEVSGKLNAGAKLRLLAVLAEQRIPGHPNVPTAREQGYDVTWPIVRGFYTGPGVSDADYQTWVTAFSRAMAAPGFAAKRAEYGLYPMSMVGAELDAYVKRSLDNHRQLATRLKLPLKN
jgi:putative tricarboxylic transport membrane protein